MPRRNFDPRRAALLLIDLQNDLVDPEGVYARNGVTSPEVQGLPYKLKPLAEAAREAEAWIVACLHTFVCGRDGEPFLSEQVRRLRPFLGKGHFQPGTEGHRMSPVLPKADIEVEKIGYSAFFMSRLEWVLWQAKVDTLLVAGITTNTSIATTVRDALMRDFKVLVLEDGCAAFSAESHRTAIKDLASQTPTLTCREAIDRLA